MSSSAWSFWLNGWKLADEGVRASFSAFMSWPCLIERKGLQQTAPLLCFGSGPSKHIKILL